MNRSNTNWLIAIVILLIFSGWITFSKDIVIFGRDVKLNLGLDLQGGLQALLEADLPTTATIASGDLETTRQILENRVNGYGISEMIMQTAGDRRIVAEFPGEKDPEKVISLLQQTGLLEFVDTGEYAPPAGTILQTDTITGASSPVDVATTPTPAADGSQPDATIYHTVVTGKDLEPAKISVSIDKLSGKYLIHFGLTPEASQIFATYTAANVNKVLTITLDKVVISAPTINSAITGGEGTISGNFTADSANALAINLKSGSLPVPVKVVESRTVGATLGEESIRKSVVAGIIGLSVVIIFMILYYRLPGFIADLALITYAIFSIAIFKTIGVTLTLPGIAGFILSIGMAVDANVLIFERLKEELRAGRNLRQAIELGWDRAWPSIRDSNASTLITCVILYIFGNTFGASMVKGFSVTLFLGVIVSLFTATTVTRTFLHTLLDNLKSVDHPRWFGL